MIEVSLTVLWLGLMTSLSPCPLATNLAAVSYLSKQLNNQELWRQSLMYTIGRSATYLILAALLSLGLTSSLELSQFVQSSLNYWLGPVLLLVGAVLLGWLPFPSLSITISQRIQNKLSSSGSLGALALGALFSLSFCPTSAVLFFGSLVPLLALQQANLLLPLIYGIGTALPVLIIAFLLSRGSAFAAQKLSLLSKLERGMKLTAGAVFISVGIYYSIIYLMPVIVK